MLPILPAAGNRGLYFMEDKPFFRSFGVLVMTAAILAAYPLAHRAFPWLQGHFRTYDPRSMLGPVDAVHDSAPPALAEDERPATVPPPMPVAPEAVLPREAFTPAFASYAGSIHLQSFRQLLKAGDEQIRVAYFGDSSVEGDLISQTLRESLQQRYGGSGVGFLPILPAVNNFRRTVYQAASGHWRRHKPRSDKPQLPVGITGNYFTASLPLGPEPGAGPESAAAQTAQAARSRPDPWVTFSAGKAFTGTRYFPEARLLYGSPEGAIAQDSQMLGSIGLEVGTARTEIALTASGPLNILNLPVRNATRIKLNFTIPGHLPVYGVSMESTDGIIIDNFPMRGNSGNGLLRIPQDQLAAFHKALDYDLVLLQFGLNVLNAGLKDFRWYEEQTISTIVHLKKSMPGAGIVVIGLPDKSIKVDGAMRSDPSVARITAAQRRAAFRCGVPFFSIYEAMGGEGSMVEWVERRRLANWDYTHFNFEGAERIGNFLLKFLLGEDSVQSGTI
jgi:lysophospholipase L1-like esterase